MQPRQTLAPTDDLELGSVYTAVSEAPPPYNDHHHQSARGMTPLTFDWRRPATALVMTAGVAVLAGVFSAIHGGKSLYANMCSEPQGPGPDGVHLLTGWMCSSVGTVIWLLTC